MVHFMSDGLFWFFLGLIILLLEIAAPGLILFFFGIGAWVTALVTAIYPLSVSGQLFVFLITSVVTLVVLRRRFEILFKGFSQRKDNPSVDMDDLTGKKATVVKKIVPPKEGKVEIFGTHWIAESEYEIDEGETVVIEKKKNLTLYVKKV